MYLFQFNPKKKQKHKKDQDDTVCTGIELSAQCNATGVTQPISVSGIP
jgi:hypothetical protein